MTNAFFRSCSKPCATTGVTLATVLLATALLAPLRTASAQDRPPTSGEIYFEDTKEKANGYEKSREGASELFANLKQVAAAGAGSTVAAPSEGTINYLTAAYLYCAVNTGTCPFFLEALFEVDILNSKAAGAASCPTMTQFWKQWVRNGFEERHKYMVKTPFLQETSDFKTNVRPKYLRCKETISEMMTTGAVNGKRYGPTGEAMKPIDQTIRYLDSLKETIPNVFVAVGAQKASSDEDQPAKGQKPRGSAQQAAPAKRRQVEKH